MRELTVTQRAELDRLLDEVMIAHVGLATGPGDPPARRQAPTRPGCEDHRMPTGN
jgi:hypothetical protein